MTSVQARADGGTRLDDSAERQIRGWLVQLARLESRLEDVWDEAEALALSDLRIDPARGLALLRSEGRRIVASLARALNTAPAHDAFASFARCSGRTSANWFSGHMENQFDKKRIASEGATYRAASTEAVIATPGRARSFGMLVRQFAFQLGA